MQTLEKEGFLQFGLRGGLLPGERLHVAALNILRSSRHKALRQAILRQLSEAIGETCGLAIPDGLDMLYFDRVQTNWPLQINLPIGSHTPLWCTASGKLYLASLPPEQLERVLPHLPLQRMARNTLTDLSALRDDLARVREEQLGTDCEEFIDGMVACAVPVRASDGELLACLFSHAPVIRCSMAQLLAFVPRMRRCTRTGGGARQRGGAGGRSEHVEQSGDEVQQAADHHEDVPDAVPVLEAVVENEKTMPTV